jgi:hypothetical protein
VNLDETVSWSAANSFVQAYSGCTAKVVKKQ